MRVLVTGHLGYIGTVMVPMLLKAGHEVVGLDSDLYRALHLCRRRRHRRRAAYQQGRARRRRAGTSKGSTPSFTWRPCPTIRSAISTLTSPTASITAPACISPGSPRPPRSSASCSPHRAAITAWPAMRWSRRRARSTRSRPMASPRSAPSATSPCSPDDDFCPVYLRPATAYGLSPRIRFDIVLNNLVAWAVTTGLIYLKSDGSPWRPIVHIEDISRAFIAALEAPEERVHQRGVQCRLHRAQLSHPRHRRDRCRCGAGLPARDCLRRRSRQALLSRQFRQDRPRAAGLQAAMGRPPWRRAALCRLSPVRPHPRRVRRARAISASAISRG